MANMGFQERSKRFQRVLGCSIAVQRRYRVFQERFTCFPVISATFLVFGNVPGVSGAFQGFKRGLKGIPRHCKSVKEFSGTFQKVK